MIASILAQSIGLLATSVSVTSVTLECDRRLRLAAACGQSIWMIHFALLGAQTSAAIAALACTRQLSSLWLQGCSPRLQTSFTHAFYVGFTLAAVATWQGPRSLLPWSIAMLCNFAYGRLTGVPMRKALRVADALALANGLVVGSIGGVVTACLSIVLNTRTLRRIEVAAPPRPVTTAA